MKKEIRYNGLTTVPPDNTCPDGDAAMLLNLVPEDGALKPVLPPKMVMTLLSDQRVVYIHTTSAFKHYIIHDTDENKLYWITPNVTSLTDLRAFESAVIYQVTGIGNTLVVLTGSGMHYFLWKGDADGYLYLGTQIPELPISFGLQGEMQRTDEFEINFDSLPYETKTVNGVTFDSYYEFTDENKTKVSNQVLGKVNKFIVDRSTNKGKFLYPFLVRYAYRLYDGSLVKHSAPVLMVCSTSCAPMALWNTISKERNSATVRIVGMLHTLDYAVVKSEELENIKAWSDIVKSVDIFISAPIYTYNQNGQCDKFFNYNEYGDAGWGYIVCKHTNQAADTTTYPLRYQMKDVGYLYQMTFDANHLKERMGGVLGLPRKDSSAVKEDIRNCSSFYLLNSINLEQLTTTRTIVNVEEDYLQSLVSREVMTDDYDSHDNILSRFAFSYNSRLNLANLKKQLFQGYNGSAIFNYTDGFVRYVGDGVPTLADSVQGISVFVYIKQDGKDIIVRGDLGSIGFGAPKLFFYYPNINAYKAVIAIQESYVAVSYIEIPLEKHSFLNGAFYFSNWEDVFPTLYRAPVVSSDAERTVDIPNKIYTSEINNPFYFPLLGINTVGTGTIIGISSAVKALSEGQFGQFPLYAFTTEGVWALEVSLTGTYSARQPITRDVCKDSESITQMDGAVLFATDRGIMLLEGSKTTCISDVLNGKNIVPVTALPKIEKIFSHAGMTTDTLQMRPFMDFVKDCRMIYDYEHQRIILYNIDCSYAYVFSLKSKQWGMMQSNIADSVNSYPDALAVLNNGSLVNYSDEADDGAYKNIAVSRPIKLDAYDVHKSIDTVIQRGMFRKGHVKTILYASNDLMNWMPVWSSTDHYLRGFSGTPYKFFRIALLTNLSNDEGITGCTVQFTPRLSNQPR